MSEFHLTFGIKLVVSFVEDNTMRVDLTKAREAGKNLGINPDDILQDIKGNIIFKESALDALALKIKDLGKLVVGFQEMRGNAAKSVAMIKLKDGTTIQRDGVCFVGSSSFDGSSIDADGAVNISKSRALADVMRAVGADPIKILMGVPLALPDSEEQFRVKQQAVHVIKNELKMSDGEYRRRLKEHGGGKDSTSKMNLNEICAVAAHFQALKSL